MYESIYLLAMFEMSGLAILPVGVIVRDPETDHWRKSMLSISEAEVWDGILEGIEDTLPEKVVQRWESQANGITWDVNITRIDEARDLDHAIKIAEAALLQDYTIIVEES